MTPTRKLALLFCVAAAALAVAAAALLTRHKTVTPETIFAAWPDAADPRGITISNPLDGAVFPRDIASPTIRWGDSSSATTWVVAITSARGKQLSPLLTAPQWQPPQDAWQHIRDLSLETDARIVVMGVGPDNPEILSAATITLRTSRDAVEAPIFYREVNLPFVEAVKDPSKIRWRFGPVSSPTPPPVVLTNLPVCGNCHSFSADGSVMGMDVDYANDKGSYAIAPVQEKIVLDDDKIITWADYRRSDKTLTFGLLSRVSPDGRYVVSTVKDRSVFVPKDDLEFSQLFFPIKGVLVVYDRETKTFAALPGADDPDLVQSNPTWSPDGKEIIFARSEAYELKGVGTEALLTPAQCDEFLSGKKGFRFDLYRIPFNGGTGGKAVAVSGASDNQTSNFFPKFSPDGKWIVFCRAKDYMLLQPDSALYIMPAAGGHPRRMRCNTDRMNSWHSWSPNGRWLVFSSKANGPYTQLWIAHVDTEGRSSRPVLLEQFTSPDRAANIPEFVAASPTAIRRIRENFLDDLSFFRAGNEALIAGDFAAARKAYEKSLAIKPDNPAVINNLGTILMQQGDMKGAEACFTKAVAADPGHVKALSNLGMIREYQGRLDDAMVYYRRSLKLDPTYPIANMRMGRLLSRKGKLDEAIIHWRRALQSAPYHVEARLALSTALVRQGKNAQAVALLDTGLKDDPHNAKLADALAWILATCPDDSVRNGPRAVELAELAASSAKTNQPFILDTLAAAYAEAGQYDKAVATAQRALAIARAQRSPLGGEIRRRLAHYRSGRPWRQKP